MLEFSHRAMACDFVVLVRDEHSRLGGRSVADPVLDALESVDAIERRLTVYDASSEISAINRSAGTGPVRVSKETFAVLEHAVRLSESMDGAFDVTAGPLIDAWGFTTRNGRKPTAEEIAEALSLVGMKYLQLDSEHRTAELTLPSMRINLGGIGKGDAIDRVAAKLRASGVKDFLIHAGQSSVLAAGDQFAPPEDDSEDDSDSDPPPRGWMVGISHPTKPHRRIAGIWLRDAALATSGSGKQFFHHRGKRYGHVIDPRDGQPAGDLLSLSVMTKTALDADAMATGLFVMGGEQARQFASAASAPATSGPHDPLPLIMVAADRRQDSVSVRTIGPWEWADPPEGWGNSPNSGNPEGAKTDDELLT